MRVLMARRPVSDDWGWAVGTPCPSEAESQWSRVRPRGRVWRLNRGRSWCWGAEGEGPSGPRDLGHEKG